VTPEAYGKFLIDLCEAWYPQDVGRVFVRHFESILLKSVGLGRSLCYLEPHCHPGLTVEHEGSIYGCDHFVTEKWYLGSVDDPQWVHWDAHPRYGQNVLCPAYKRFFSVSLTCLHNLARQLQA
jgi:uncharacterized protein